MALSIYLRLTDYNNRVLTANGQYDNSATAVNNNTIDSSSTQFLMINSYSSNIEQTLSIGSQSTGAGAGKITFNPMVITKRMDTVSPLLFQAAASGTAFKTVEVFFANSANMISLKHTYKLVAVKTVSWSADVTGEGVTESVSFEYGGLMITVNPQTPDGKIALGNTVGWNRVRNVLDNDPAAIIGAK